MFDYGNSLLHVLSARQHLSWQMYKRLFDTFYLQMPSEYTSVNSVSVVRQDVTRALDLLGHCDFSFDSGGTVDIAPPVLALLPKSGFPEAIVCGERMLNMPGAIQKACGDMQGGLVVRCEAQGDGPNWIPDRIVISAKSRVLLADLATRLNLNFNDVSPAQLLLNFVAPLKGYLSSLDWRQEPELNWRCQFFHTKALKFVSGQMKGATLAGYEDPKRLIYKYYLRKDNRVAVVDKDWGRYAALYLEHNDVLIYDQVNEKMAVPYTVPLPRLFARILGLCSGRVPNVHAVDSAQDNGQQRYFVYTGVTPEIAISLSGKLGQTLMWRMLK
jgi:hypothetical protein